MEFPRRILLGSNVLEQVAQLGSSLAPGTPRLVLCDDTTRRLAGDRAAALLEAAGDEVQVVTVDAATLGNVGKVKEAATKVGAGLLFAVGGGSVIDTTKLAAFEVATPFVSVPTSAAHDGISSARASIKDERGNTSRAASPPSGVLADTRIIASAPHRMLASGCGDIVSNLTAVLDWELSRDQMGASFSTMAAALARTAAEALITNADRIRPNDEMSARIVVKSLIVSGLAMSMAGDSRPASGAEHLVSHMLDRLSPGSGLHGEQCGVASILMMRLHDGDWKMIRDTLARVGAPTTLSALGIDAGVMIKALTEAHAIRPERPTILGANGITEATAKRLLDETGVG